MPSHTPLSRTRVLSGAVGAALAALFALAPPAAAAPASVARSTGVRSGTGWLDVRVGLTFGDSLTLGDQIRVTNSRGPAEIFGIGATYRTSRLDIGVLLEGIGSFYFEGVSRDNRTGSQFRLAANVRWRYIDEPWGALFLRLSPGLMAFDHSDELRFQAANLFGKGFDEADRNGVGFSLGFDFGILLYLSRAVAISIHLDVVTGTTTMDVGKDSIDIGITRGLFTAGLEWRM
ncbi:MAG: hypothetical protein H6745_10340 [Deltaproteobacteria bacterium]|nr:hypothetical protein [Deltaproteobacteria bacterium]